MIDEAKYFNSWYYVNDKCDTRFDDGHPNAYYKCFESFQYGCRKQEIENENLKAQIEILEEVLLFDPRMLGMKEYLEYKNYTIKKLKQMREE